AEDDPNDLAAGQLTSATRRTMGPSQMRIVHTGRVVGASDRNRPIGMVKLNMRLDRHLSLPVHRTFRVSQQIHKNLVDAVRLTKDQWGGVIEAELHRNAAKPTLVPQKGDHTLDGIVDIDFVTGDRSGPRI